MGKRVEKLKIGKTEEMYRLHQGGYRSGRDARGRRSGQEEIEKDDPHPATQHSGIKAHRRSLTRRKQTH